MRFLRGKVDKRNREPNVIVDAMWTQEEVEKEFTRQVAIKFQRGLHDAKIVNRVRDILQKYPGKSEVTIVVDTTDEAKPNLRLRFIAQKPIGMKVSCSRQLRLELNDVLGPGHLHFAAEPKRRAGGGQSIGR